MDESIFNALTQSEEKQEKPKTDAFATVGTVYGDGISLIFDGTSTQTAKHYKCNTSIHFTAGQRVKLDRDSGTYVVAYAVGNPI